MTDPGSAVQHVSRREAERLLLRGEEIFPSMARISDAFSRANKRFASGRRLDAEGFRSVVDDMRSAIADADPVLSEETAKPATRAHPSGEKHEFLFVGRASNGLDPRSVFGFHAYRILVTRKKVLMEFDYMGVDATRHTLERAIQRDIVGWNDVAAVETALFDNIGLACVWRQAYRRGLLQGNRVMFPLGEGVLLGTISTKELPRLHNRKETDKHAVRVEVLEHHRLNAVLEGDYWNILRLEMGTAVNSELTTLMQDNLRAAIAAFSDRHRTALEIIRRCSLWRGATLSPNPAPEIIAGPLDILADELAAIMAAHPDALKVPRTERVSTGHGPFGPLAGAPSTEQVTLDA